jgi:N-methylhydantoinase B
VTAAYHRPESVEAAVALLAGSPSALIVAGATDVYPAQTARLGWGAAKITPEILDLSRVAALRGIADRGDHWWLGACTTWTDIMRADLPPALDGLKAAAREIGAVQIQNRGTIGGNLVTASPAGDSIPCLLTLDAHVVTASARGERRLPLAQFLTGYRKTALEPGEMLIGLRVPKTLGRGHFLKLGARKYLVISIVMVAGLFEADASGIVINARLAVGACSAVAQRLPPLEAKLIGHPLGAVRPKPDDLTHLTPIDDVRASADYRRAAALQLLSDLIENGAREARA